MRPYLVRYRPPPLSVSVPSALPFSPSLSACYSSSSVPLRSPRPATTFAPGRIDTRKGGCNDRRPIRSAAIKLYHRLEWRLYFGNLATRHSYKTPSSLPMVQKYFSIVIVSIDCISHTFEKPEWTRMLLLGCCISLETFLT